MTDDADGRACPTNLHLARTLHRSHAVRSRASLNTKEQSMTQQRAIARIAGDGGSVRYDADVLVIGGGPAGCWAACNAAQHGARVVLVDKGYCGSSGATAPSGTGVWYVPPDSGKRAAAMAS